jgi:hypothetical protein
MILTLLAEMRESASKDIESNERHEPATNKMRMLPRVVDMLSKYYISPLILFSAIFFLN